MLENLKKTSVAGFLGLLPPRVIGVLFVALMAASGLAGAKFNGQRLAVKYERLQRSYESAQAQAQAVATQQTQANAEKSAKLDKTYYTEYQNATKNSDYWRNRYLTERVPSRTKTANSTETRARTGMGNDTAADIGADQSLDVRGAAIIELSESAKQMRAQVLALQEKVRADHATINGEGEGDDKQ